MIRSCALFLALAASLPAFDAGYPQPVSQQLALPDEAAPIDPALRYFLAGADAPCKLPVFSSFLPDPHADAIKELGELLGNGGAGVLASFPDLMTLLESPDARLNSVSRSVFFKVRNADERGRLFVGLDERTDWQREQLKGRPKRRLDYINGLLQPLSEVRYDQQGYRVSEIIYDSLQQAAFTRLYERGPGFCPSYIRVLDSNGILSSEVRFSLDAQGQPLQERHLDAQGQPVLTRDYQWAQGRLVDFVEQRPGAFPWRLHFDYDEAGRLVQRHAYGRKGSLQPVPSTEYLYDAQGNTTERREWINNLPLRGGVPISNGDTDPRGTLKYRWAYDLNSDGRPDDALLYASLQNQSEFRTRRFRYTDDGLLRDVTETDRQGDVMRRQAWDYDTGGDLSLIETDGAELPEANLPIDLGVDAQGNWISRRNPNDPGPAKRVFEYYP